MKKVSAWAAAHAPTGTRWGQKALSLLLSLALCLTLLPGAAFAANGAAFRDISGHWAEETIAKWQESGSIGGYGDGTFHPDSSITRAEFVKLLNRALGLTAAGSIAFTDVKESDWFYAEVAKAAAAGYATGSDGAFRPEAPITRAEAAAMLTRALALTADESRAAQFADASAIPAWAKGSVGAVAGAGYMTGYPNGTFGASGNITRAEAVVTLDRTQNVTITADGTVLSDKTVAGDLIIAESVGEGEVTLKNVTVQGDLIIRGGANSVYLDGVTVEGEVRLEKENLHLRLLGGTKLGTVVVVAKVKISGSGTIELLLVSVSGVTIAAGITVRRTETTDGAKAPTVPGSGSSSGSSSGGTSGGTTSKVVTGVAEIDPITVDYNTSKEAALAALPAKVTLKLEGGSTVQADVTGWTLDKEYDAKPNNATDYTATGTVTLPAGCTYSGGTLTAAAKLTVRGGDKTVTKIVWPSTGIEVAYDTEETTAKSRLPKELLLNTKGDHAFADVTWERKDDQTYVQNPTQATAFTYVGTVMLPDGYAMDANSSAEDLKTTGETTITVKADGDTVTKKELTGSYISDGIVEHYTEVQDELKASIPTEVRLECTDGSLITVTIKNAENWSDGTIDSSGSSKAGYIKYVNFQCQYSNLVIPDWYSFDGQRVVSASVYVKERDDTGLQAALVAAKAQLARIVATEDAALADLGKIWRAPNGTAANAVATGVQFVEESTIKTLESDLQTLVSSYQSADEFYAVDQAAINSFATNITNATTALQTALDTNIKTGSGFSQANILVNIRESLNDNNKNYNFAYANAMQPLTVEKNGQNGIRLPSFAAGVQINNTGDTASVDLRWSIGDDTWAELRNEDGQAYTGSGVPYVWVKGTNTEPRNISLTVRAIGYTDPVTDQYVNFNKTNPNAGMQVEAYNNLIVGAPIAVDTTLLEQATIPKLTSGQENKDFTVQIPLRDPMLKIQEINVSDSITGECTEDLLTDIQITAIPTQDKNDGHEESYLEFKLTATAANQLPAVVASDKLVEDIHYKKDTVTFTIPRDAITLTEEAKAEGWYIPKDGLKLTAYVWVCNPAITVDKAVRNKTDVQVWFTASYWKSYFSVRMALVPKDVTAFTGMAEGSVVSKIDGRDGGIGVTSNGTYNGIHIPASGLTAGTTYNVWVKIGDGDWMKSSKTYTHSTN